MFLPSQPCPKFGGVAWCTADTWFRRSPHNISPAAVQVCRCGERLRFVPHSTINGQRLTTISAKHRYAKCLEYRSSMESSVGGKLELTVRVNVTAMQSRIPHVALSSCSPHRVCDSRSSYRMSDYSSCAILGLLAYRNLSGSIFSAIAADGWYVLSIRVVWSLAWRLG